jgi:hypothetical protein
MKGNNPSTPLGIELAGDFGGILDGGEEGAWPHTSSDENAANPVSDVDKPVDIFDLRRRFQENRRVERRPSKHNTPSLAIRQAKGAPLLLSGSLTPADKGQTALNAFRFQSVPMWDAA